MGVTEVLAFCPQPNYHLRMALSDVQRAALEEWYALPEDLSLDSEIQAAQCDSCGANDYRPTHEDNDWWVVCNSCDHVFRTTWLPEHLVIF